MCVHSGMIAPLFRFYREPYLKSGPTANAHASGHQLRRVRTSRISAALTFIPGCDMGPFAELNIWHHTLSCGFVTALSRSPRAEVRGQVVENDLPVLLIQLLNRWHPAGHFVQLAVPLGAGQ